LVASAGGSDSSIDLDDLLITGTDSNSSDEGEGRGGRGRSRSGGFHEDSLLDDSSDVTGLPVRKTSRQSGAAPRKSASAKNTQLSKKTLKIVSNLDPYAGKAPRQHASESEDEEEARMAEEEAMERKSSVAAAAAAAKAGETQWMQPQQAMKKSEKAESDHDHYVKLLVLGDSGVGKTSLMMRYSEDTFAPQMMSTAGVDFKVKHVDFMDKRVKVQIWDTAGQEKFHVITRAYYRGAHGIVLVYDVSDPRSFENVAYWMKNIQEHAHSDVVKILVGNKTDLVHARQVTTAAGKLTADSFSVEHFEASAKEGTGVDNVFMDLAKAVCQKQAGGQMDMSKPAGKPLKVPNKDKKGKRRKSIKQCVMM
jgi:Ras-related protein Rab-8A